MSVALTRKNTFIAIALTLGLISLVAGVLYFSPWDASSSEISYWPALTMVYEKTVRRRTGRRPEKYTASSIVQLRTGPTR